MGQFSASAAEAKRRIAWQCTRGCRGKEPQRADFAIVTLFTLADAADYAAHAGLIADVGWQVAVGAIIVLISFVALRVAASRGVGGYRRMIDVSGAAWVASMLLFLGIYGPMLWKPRTTDTL